MSSSVNYLETREPSQKKDVKKFLLERIDSSKEILVQKLNVVKEQINNDP